MRSADTLIISVGGTAAVIGPLPTAADAHKEEDCTGVTAARCRQQTKRDQKKALKKRTDVCLC